MKMYPFLKHLGEYFGPVVNGAADSQTATKCKKTTDLTLNRWRTTILSDPGLIQNLQNKLDSLQLEEENKRIQKAKDIANKAKAQEEKKAKKAADALNKESVRKMKESGKTCNCSGNVIMNCKQMCMKSLCEANGWYICSTAKCKAVFCAKCSPCLSKIHEQSHQ